MACKVERDADGTTFHVPAAPATRDPGGRMLPGLPGVEVWWSHNMDKRSRTETLVIKQEWPNRSTADVVEITLGQLYDLIDAANKAVESA